MKYRFEVDVEWDVLNNRGNFLRDLEDALAKARDAGVPSNAAATVKRYLASRTVKKIVFKW